MIKSYIMEIIEILNVVETVKPLMENSISLGLPISLEELKDFAAVPEKVRKCNVGRKLLILLMASKKSLVINISAWFIEHFFFLNLLILQVFIIFRVNWCIWSLY